MLINVIGVKRPIRLPISDGWFLESINKRTLARWAFAFCPSPLSVPLRSHHPDHPFSPSCWKDHQKNLFELQGHKLLH